jgi:oxalate decarboxylase/phosphoglucose isomerase-like protein (cupin superfamily)
MDQVEVSPKSTQSGSGSDLARRMEKNVGRYANKTPDWDAFPASRGYPELSRSQIRYIGAGGSPKVDDPGTLAPEHFTLSMVHQPRGHYGAVHSHEGVLTAGWEWDGEVILARLGPRDMILHASGRPHGFRNDGNDPVLMSIMVGKGKPQPPSYTYHPSTHDPELSRNFGAKPGHSQMLSFESDDPRHREMARHIVRFSQQVPQWHAAGFARIPYVGDGGAPPRTFSNDMIFLPRGAGVGIYERPVEEAYLVLDGCVSVAWEDKVETVWKRLGPRDLILNPPGRAHRFRNDGLTEAHFMMVTGSPDNSGVDFRAA